MEIITKGSCHTIWNDEAFKAHLHSNAVKELEKAREDLRSKEAYYEFIYGKKYEGVSNVSGN